jgi:hypothetical protein
LSIPLCQVCHQDLTLDDEAIEYEIRVLYFGDYDTMDNLAKHDAVYNLMVKLNLHKGKVIFCDPHPKIEQAIKLLDIAGINEGNSLVRQELLPSKSSKVLEEPKPEEDEEKEEEKEKEKVDDNNIVDDTGVDKSDKDADTV